MFSGPMFRREFRAATRRRRPIIFRVFFASLLGAVTLGIWAVVSRTDTAWVSIPDPTLVRTFGTAVFLATLTLEVLLLVFLVPGLVAGAIADERTQDTLSLLLLTRVTPLEIVLVKFVARWLPVLSLAMTGLPVLLAAAWGAELLAEAWLALIALVSTSAFMAALSIAASAVAAQTSTARAQALIWSFAWLVGIPTLTILPIGSGTLWSDLLAEVRALCVLIAPSSPFSLVTDRTWYVRPWLAALEERVALMAGLQVVFGLPALIYAASHLKARDTNPNWMDPTRGYRPPCGDDPIYWREYEMPLRRGGAPFFVVQLRYTMILVKAVLINLFALIGTILVLAIPIGLLIATIRLGAPALAEAWRNGYGTNGPFQARMQFNFLIRAITGMVGWILGIVAPISTSGRFTTERDKKTWEPLLTTPLGGAEILWSKTRVVLEPMKGATWLLVSMWGVGLVCGAVTPIGIAWAALDMMLAGWAALALGLYLGVRPSTTSEAASRTALGMLVLVLLHGPILYAALASPREMAVFGEWSARVRWGLALAVLAASALTAIAAWVCTRQVIDRFDEWVDRPRRAPREVPTTAETTGSRRAAAPGYLAHGPVVAAEPD